MTRSRFSVGFRPTSADLFYEKIEPKTLSTEQEDSRVTATVEAMSEADRLITRVVAESAVYALYSHSGLKIYDLEGNLADEKEMPVVAVDGVIMLDKFWILMLTEDGTLQAYAMETGATEAKWKIEGAVRMMRNPKNVDLLFFMEDQRLLIRRGSETVYEHENVVDATVFENRLLISTPDELRLIDYVEKKTLRAFNAGWKIEKLVAGERLMVFVEASQNVHVIDDDSRLELLRARSGSRVVDAFIDGQIIYLLTEKGVEMWDLSRRGDPKLRTIHWPIMVGDEQPLQIDEVSDETLTLLISPFRTFPIVRATASVRDRLDRFDGLNLCDFDDATVARITNRPEELTDAVDLV